MQGEQASDECMHIFTSSGFLMHSSHCQLESVFSSREVSACFVCGLDSIISILRSKLTVWS
jgi:hypothetical protein